MHEYYKNFGEKNESLSPSTSSGESSSEEKVEKKEKEDTTQSEKKRRRKMKSTAMRTTLTRYFASNREATCENCGLVGHFSFECPKSKRSHPCYRCGRTDHLMSNCPNELCHNCLLPGHKARDCSERNFRGVRCHFCGEKGHIAMDQKCPEKLYDMTTNAARDATCLYCGRRGHIDCSGNDYCQSRPFCYVCGALGHPAQLCSLRMPDVASSRDSLWSEDRDDRRRASVPFDTKSWDRNRKVRGRQ